MRKGKKGKASKKPKPTPNTFKKEVKAGEPKPVAASSSKQTAFTKGLGKEDNGGY